MTATITKATPFRELDSMERRMRHTFEEFGVASALPEAEVHETADEIVVELEVPGYEEKDLGIQVTDHMLEITGTRKELKEKTEKAFYLQEELERTFQHSFQLPLEADTEHVKALFKKGVLEVHTPKLHTETPTKVEITSA